MLRESLRRAIRELVCSRAFRQFLAETQKADERHWPVALIVAERLRAMELPEQARIVRLSSYDVANSRHRKRWLGWYGNQTDARDWVRVQTIIDAGEWGRHETNLAKRWLWLQDGRHWWRILIQASGNGEVFLNTYHQSNAGQVESLRARKEEMLSPKGP